MFARVTEKIAGPGYCFPTSQTVIRPVPDAAKNKLFMSDAELYAAAPELDYRKRKRRTKTEKAEAFAAQLQQWGGKPAASIETAGAEVIERGHRRELYLPWIRLHRRRRARLHHLERRR